MTRRRTPIEFDDYLDELESERAEKREIDRDRAGTDRVMARDDEDTLRSMLADYEQELAVFESSHAFERTRAALVSALIPDTVDLDSLEDVVAALYAAGLNAAAFTGVFTEAIELARERRHSALMSSAIASPGFPS